jgi:hypothetical protein
LVKIGQKLWAFHVKTYDKINMSSLSQREVVAELGQPQSLSKLLKSHGSLNNNGTSENRKRKDKWKSHTIAEALLVWFKQARSMNAAIFYRKSVILVKN